MPAGEAWVARLDYVVQGALELAYTAVQHDDNVGVMAFADGVQHFVVPQRGRLALRRGLDVLARGQSKLGEPHHPGPVPPPPGRHPPPAPPVPLTHPSARFASDPR